MFRPLQVIIRALRDTEGFAACKHAPLNTKNEIQDNAKKATTYTIKRT
jgi:hypothetical protein